MGDRALEETINAFFQEFISGDLEHESEMSFYRFSCFMSHCKLLGSNCDHAKMLEIFRKVTNVTAEESGLGEEEEPVLDLKGFRRCLEALSEFFYGKARMLGSLLSDIGLRREGIFDPEHITETQDLMFRREMIDAVYHYSESLKALFLHYTSGGKKDEAVTWKAVVKNPTTFAVYARSFYRLCRASAVVPGVMVPAELLELARDLSTEKKPEAKRFFDDEKMISGGENQTWTQPVTSAALSGEPKYDFPRFVEALAAVALCSPPPVYQEPMEEQLTRLHEIFTGFLGLPRNVSIPKDWTVQQAFRAAGGARDDGPPNPEAMMESLSVELPSLPEPPKLVLTDPPADAELLKPPPTVDEQIAASLAAAGQKKKKKKKEEDNADDDRINWGQVTYFQKRPQTATPDIPLEYRRERRGEEWTRFDNAMLTSTQRPVGGPPSTSNGRPVGRTLRASLIDEPLLPPQCESPEVTTLMETAATSRRLRDYDIAIRLLIQARVTWAKHVVRMKEGKIRQEGLREGVVHMSLARGGDAGCTEADADEDDEGSPRRSEGGAFGDGEDGGNHESTGRLLQEALRGGSTQPLRPSSAQSHGQAGPGPGGARGPGPPQERLYEPEVDFERLFATAGDSQGSEPFDILPLEVNLFFYCEFASLHTALRADTLALRLLTLGKKYSDMLPLAHPDTAVVWSGVGRVAMHMGATEVAARSFLKVQEIRERTLGGNTVETATAYHNVAVAFMELQRNREATAYLTLSSALFDMLLGESHPRTLTCRRNLGKAKASQQKLNVEMPNMYYIPFKDYFPAGGKKKKKKAGKKK